MSLLYQLDTSVIGTMFSDTGKTTQITNGGTCAAWTAPNGLITTDAVQSTSANRPTYRSNYSSSGYSGLEFDDSNDQMSIAHSSGWNLTIIDMFIVLTSTSLAVGTYKGIVTKFGDVNWNTGWGATYSLGTLSSGAPSFSNFTVKGVINSRIACHFHFENGSNGCDQGVIYGGTTAGTGPSNTTTDVVISGASGGNYPFAGAIHEIKIYGGGETDQTIIDVKNALRAKWGLASVASSCGLQTARGMNGGMRS